MNLNPPEVYNKEYSYSTVIYVSLKPIQRLILIDIIDRLISSLSPVAL